MWAWSTTSKKRLCFKKERLLWRKGFLTGSAERERVPWKGFTFEFIVYFGEETMSQEKTKKHQKDSKNKKYTNLVRTPNKNNPQLPRGLGKGRSKSSSWKTVLFPLVSFIYIYTHFFWIRNAFASFLSFIPKWDSLTNLVSSIANDICSWAYDGNGWDKLHLPMFYPAQREKVPQKSCVFQAENNTHAHPFSGENRASCSCNKKVEYSKKSGWVYLKVLRLTLLEVLMI